jgi:hypothetical protein
MEVSIVIPVSRMEYIKQVFENVNNLECDINKTNLLVYVDGSHELFQKTRNIVITTKFKEKLCDFRAKGIGTVSSFVRRRQRISDIHNEMRNKINKCDYVLLMEDDTLVKPNALKLLLEGFAQYPDAGIISGIQIGRWGFTVIGGWQVDNIENIQTITSIPLDKGIKEVDATGLYFGLVKTENYLNHTFKPFEKVLGPDTDFGISLRQKGFKNYVNYDVDCLHLTKREILSVATTNIQRVKLTRVGQNWAEELI